MKVHTAQLAGGTNNADCVLVTDHAVIVLDGATAFEPVDVNPDTYAATLAAAIGGQLDHGPTTPLTDVVAAAISQATARLHLTPGRSPSSTVTILRIRDDVADLYVLGDSPLHYGTDQAACTFTDNRLDAVAPAERAHYLTRLRNGHGFDDEHHCALIALQRAQRAARNTPGGYWIAEANPAAAHHALTQTLTPEDITWAVLATDGAADYIDYRGPAWPDVAHCDDEQLAALLDSAAAWEADTDPDAQTLPRPKRHDDKTLAAVPAFW